MRLGPTANILEFARSQPGGVIRWRDATYVYRQHSAAATRDRSRGETHYHMNVGHILRKYFTKVDGVPGYYVLSETIVGED